MLGKIHNYVAAILIRLKFVSKEDSPLLKISVFLWLILLIIILASGLINISSGSKAFKYEYFALADSIVKGHGFSFNECESWGFGGCRDSDKYIPTAHEEPVYPYFMAFLLKTFVIENEFNFTVQFFNLIALLLTSVVVYYLARKVFNAPTGIIAASLLPLWPGVRYLSEHDFNPAIFAGLLISISCYLVIWCSENMSLRRGIVLGGVLGFSSLTYAPIIPFIPLSALFILVSRTPIRTINWKTALIIVVTALVVISPWSIRNFIVFGHLVPVKSGFGIIAHVSNPILAATFTSGSHACTDTLGPFWKARNAKEAIEIGRTDSRKKAFMLKRSFDCIQQQAPEGYEQYNYVERDKFYLRKTREFILSEPKTFAIMAYDRIISFLFFTWAKGTVSFLFLISAVVSFRNPKARILTVLSLSYLIPYLFIVMWFYRYRYPIEPVIHILAAYVPVLFISKLYMLYRSSSGKRKR
ncbi:MAG: glycosyltransferase family 39 protein [Nitrospirae bacterium]|nr:glycosyltransferase family 39 protein [Nitrospirota bacterium]